MPTPTTGGQRVAANWETVVKPKPEDNIHEDYWLANRMKSGKGFMSKSGGDFIVQPLEYALNSTTQSYSDMDTFSTTRVDVFDRCEFQWKEIITTVVMSYLEKDRNSGDGQVFDLLPAKLENGRKSHLADINRQAYGDGTGNGGKDLTGLAALVSATPTTGTVGGINRANFSFWRNQQASGALTTTAFDNLRSVMRSIYNLCSNGVNGNHPQFGVTTRTVFEGYEGLLTANERFTDKTTGDGGFKNEAIKFKGMLLAYDNDQTTGQMHMLHPDYYKWVYKSGAWMKLREKIEPGNQTAEIYAIRTMMNTIAINPRMLGVITSIT